MHAWCAVLCLRCPGPPAFCSPVPTLVALCCVCGVLGHLAPVYQCARLVCCVAFAGRRCGACTCPSGRRLSRSRHGLSTLRARTRPSGRRLFCSRQGLGTLLGAHTSIRTEAGGLWSWRGRAGPPPGRVLLRRTVAVAVLLLSPAPLGCVRLCCAFLLFFCAPPPCVRLFVALGSGALWLTHPRLFLWRPPCVCLFVVSGPGCPGPQRFVADPLPSSLLLFCPPCLCFSAACCLGCPGPRCFVAACPRVFFFSFFSCVVRCPALSW